MKTNLLLILILIFCSNSAFSQNSAGNSTRTTVYENFGPALISLSNGKSVIEKQANIFLKNGSLLYKYNNSIRQAEISKIKSVKFSDRTYVRVDTLLAYVMDSVNDNKLLCATLVDMEAYKTQLLNDRQITNLELGNHINVTAMGNFDGENENYPLINFFFYEINGKIIKSHERAIQKALPKDKQRIFKTLIQSPSFSWGDIDSLKKILTLLSENTH